MNKVSYKKSYNETIKKVVAKELTKKEFAFKQEITDIQVQKNFIFFSLSTSIKITLFCW